MVVFSNRTNSLDVIFRLTPSDSEWRHNILPGRMALWRQRELVFCIFQRNFGVSAATFCYIHLLCSHLHESMEKGHPIWFEKRPNGTNATKFKNQGKSVNEMSFFSASILIQSLLLTYNNFKYILQLSKPSLFYIWNYRLLKNSTYITYLGLKGSI